MWLETCISKKVVEYSVMNPLNSFKQLFPDVGSRNSVSCTCWQEYLNNV